MQEQGNTRDTMTTRLRGEVMIAAPGEESGGSPLVPKH